MIIEAGYDLVQILHPEVLADAASRRALWMLAADKDLRLLEVSPVCPEFSGSLEPHVADIVAAIAGCYRPVRYFALAHTVSPLDCDDWPRISWEDEALREAHNFEPDQFLGRLVFDGDHIHSSAPRYSFRDYVGRENLPRAAVIAGPHFGDCECLACSQFNEMMAEYRALREAAEPGPAG